MLERDAIPPPAGGALSVLADFGEFTHGLVLWPLERGGMYVAAEVRQESGEIADFTADVIGEAMALQAAAPGGGREPLVEVLRYDSAGVQSARTFVATVENQPGLLAGVDAVMRYNRRQRRRVASIRTQSIAFNRFKVMGVDWIRHLLNRAAEGRTDQVLAISPRCRVLLREMRGLEKKDDGTGRVRKGDDHGPDALVCGAAPIHAAHRGQVVELDTQIEGAEAAA
jgi:hypothetical protein